MLWLLVQSVRQNARKYWLAVVGVAASVLVSVIGISASQALWRMAQYPVSQMLGGELMILDQRVALAGSQGGVYAEIADVGHVDEEAGRSLVARVLPSARVTATLVVPCLVRDNEFGVVQGRQDETGQWLYAPQIVAGRQLSPSDDGNALLVRGRIGSAEALLGQQVILRLPRAIAHDGDITWSLADGESQTYSIEGVFGQPAPNGNMWTPLAPLQRQTGAIGTVTYIGVALSDPATLSDSVDQLRAEIARTGLPFQVMSSEDIGRLMIADFQSLESLAGYYTPAMCLVAVIIVLATGLALAANRRRELSLLRSIGLGVAAMRALFFWECLFVVLAGALLGTVAAALATQAQFGYAVWNPLPAGIVIAISSLLAAGCSLALFSRTGTLRTLRNS